MIKIQTLKNQCGEVNFRKKLALQFAGKAVVYPGEPSYKQNILIIKDRVKDYKKYFSHLTSQGLVLENGQLFLEIGAGIGQGAMLLENKYLAHGFASDISYETLLLSNRYIKRLKFTKMPIRICADTLNLPFKSGSIPFVFCFETLHHFPDPKPVLQEVYRVLIPGGYFYFNEEPVAQSFNLNLWQRDRNLRWFEKILKALIVLHFISRIGKSEIENDILEEAFTLGTWENALNVFDEVETTLKVFPFGPKITRIRTKKPGWLNPPFIKKLILQFLGGGIEALCRKAEGDDPRTQPQTELAKSQARKNVVQLNTPPKLHESRVQFGTKQTSSECFGDASGFFGRDELVRLLACPNCKHKPPLKIKNHTTLFCPVCKTTYKSKNGIFMLFSKEQMEKLYPSF